MEKNEQVDIEIPEEENLGDLDESTDWKLKADELQKKHREAGIRNRERTKALKDKIAELEKPKVSEKEIKSDESVLLKKLEKLSLRSAGITADDEIELALTTAKKWGMDVEDVTNDEDFKVKLERLRTTKANADATSNIRGGGGNTGAKDKVEYWLAKGEAPPRTPENRKLRMDYLHALMAKDATGKKFYND